MLPRKDESLMRYYYYHLYKLLSFWGNPVFYPVRKHEEVIKIVD